ncbi:hypothetical protein SDJN02_13250, partial [Cucurbita argyrosperma subsp. argyrosperma]
MMVEDEWLTAAMAEDSVVADLLVRLKQSQAASPSKSPRPMKLPFNWGVRQPRSRTAAAMAAVVVRCGDVVLQRNNKDVDSTRCSPTTPLSWSGGASPSATLDGYEASSRHATLLHVASRFKGAVANESPACTTTKRLRRKKELATLQASFEEQRAKNESLKKMKVDFNLKYPEKFSTNSNMMHEESSSTLTHQRESSNNIETSPPTIPFTGSGSSEAQSQKKTKSTEEDSVFLLPDLNMTPSEDY